MESFEEDLATLLECEDGSKVDEATVKLAIKLLWKAPVLHASVLKVLSNTCALELQKQSVATGFVITTLVTDNISQLLDHQTNSWAPMAFEWGVRLLTAVSKVKHKSEYSLETSLRNWLGIKIIQVISNIVTRSVASLLPKKLESCVKSLLELTKNESDSVRWIMFHVISQSPCLMVPQVIQQAARLHQISDNNCLVVNLAHCLSRLARFHSDIVKDSLTNFILALFDVTDQIEIKRRFDFLFWLVKTDVTLFLLATSDSLYQITAAKIQAVLRVYRGVKKVTLKVKEVTIVKEEVSEDEGEVISSSEEEDGKKDPVMADQGVTKGATKSGGPSEVEGADDMKKISVTTDYTPSLVELLCHLRDDVAMGAVRLLIDSAQMMNSTLNDDHPEEAMEEEGEMSGDISRVNEAGRALNLLLLKMQEVAFTHLYPATKGTGTVAEEIIQFAAALQSKGTELCDMLLEAEDDMIQYWLYQLIIMVGQICSDMHAGQLVAHLLMKCDSKDKLSVVVNIFHEVSVVHTQLAHSTLQSAVLTCCQPVTKHLTVLMGNVLTLVQLPKSSAKQLQVRGYFLEAAKDQVLLLSQLLVETVNNGDMSATGKLLSLATTVEGHCQSLSEHIDIVRNLLRCYFDLIKISQKDGDCDIECDMLLTSCCDVIISLLSRQQDGLSNYVFSSVIKTVLSNEMRSYFGAASRSPKGGMTGDNPTLVLHNLNNLMNLLCGCCHANPSHYLQVSMAMMDHIAPSIVPDHVPWPTREHFKYFMEVHLHVKRQFDENPVLWSLLQLLAEDSSSILWCSGLVCALMCVLVNHWLNMKNKLALDTPTELKASCSVVEVLAKARWLHSSMVHISEVFHLLTAPELFQIMSSIYDHIKLHLSTDKDPTNLEDNLQQYVTSLKTILRAHVVKLGPLFARYYPNSTGVVTVSNSS